MSKACSIIMVSPRSQHRIMSSKFVSICVVFLVGLPLGMLGGCKEAKQVVDVAHTLAEQCATGPMYQRLKWKAEDFFADPGVISLCKAIEAKDVQQIDRLVKSGVDVNAKGRGNMTPLLWAFPAGEEMFKKMLELGADPNIKLTENVLTLRGKSVMFASVELVDGLIYSQFFYDVSMENYLALVLAHGGIPNAEDLDGKIPLFTAVRYSPHAPGKIAQLIRFGAKINRPRNSILSIRRCKTRSTTGRDSTASRFNSTRRPSTTWASVRIPQSPRTSRAFRCGRHCDCCSRNTV